MYSCVKLRNLFLVSLVCLLALTSLAQSQTRYSGGAGTAQSPYEIATAQDLIDLGINTGDYGKHFIMTENIDLAGRVFDKAVIAADSQFAGSFNGNDHTISNLTIHTQGNAGLFGYLGSGSNVTKLSLENIDITGSSAGGLSGGICGSNRGKISICSISGQIGGGGELGGLCGYNYGTIRNSYSTAMVSVAFGDVGGLCGYNYGTITGCFASGIVEGSISIHSNRFLCVGGLVGTNGATVMDSYS
ncbi:MAG: hypothetical protein JW745_01200, partial [Sedimentisphaerales bacterium]|nr:hypothetical protein [Sedimentisphaerales bacterium]